MELIENLVNDAESYQRVNEILRNLSEIIVLIDKNWNVQFVNRPDDPLLGNRNSIGQPVYSVYPELTDTPFSACYARVMTKRKQDTIEAYYAPAEKWLKVNAFPISGGGIGVAILENTERKQLHTIIASQTAAIELALSNLPLSKALEPLLSAVETLSGNGAIGSILLADDEGKTLHHGASANLPEAYCSQIDGIAIADNTGSCGTAAFRRQQIVCENISDDPKWQKLKTVALPHGLQACWSTPILSVHSGKILGTFAVYYPFPQVPAKADIEMVNTLCGTAAILIEKERQNEARIAAERAANESLTIINQQRRLYETALSNAADLYYIVDLEHRIQFANTTLLDVYGKTWEEVKGKTCFELGYEQWHAEQHEREFNWVIETGKSVIGEVPFESVNGPRVYEYIFTPVKDENDKVEAIAGSTRDITDRLAQEKRRRVMERRHRVALEASHSFGIWEYDLKNEQMTMDIRLAELFGLSAEEAVIGISLHRFFESVYHDDRARVASKMTHRINQGGLYSDEFRLKQQDDNIRWVSFRGQNIYDEDIESAIFTGVGVDITTEHDALEALRNADRKKDEFLATLAHELRNPLAPIRHSVEIMQNQSLSSERLKQMNTVLTRQITQMVRLVDDLMDVSRITRGKINLQIETLAISDAIESAVENIQPMITLRQHRLIIDKLPTSLIVKGDAVRLSQVFSNIINNAAKYTPQGGEISIRCELEDDLVYIYIKDNGIGIPLDKQRDIFDMFSQVEDVVERAEGGLGIGLTLVQQLVRLHNGDISVFSEGKGHGTEFKVSLPAAIRPDIEKTGFSPQTAATRDHSTNLRLKVLVVDDNKDAAVTMGWLLEALNCEVIVLDNGNAALTSIETFTPDIAMLDIGMPGMNGYQLCRALKAHASLKHTIFVAQTGWGQQEHRDQARQAGFHHHIVKPLNLEDIKPILQKKRQRLMAKQNG